MLASFLSESFSYTSRAGFNFIIGLSLEIPCWLHFYRGVSLTHPVLTSLLSGEFLLHIPGWLLFSFSFFFFFFFWFVVVVVVVVVFKPVEFLLHIP